MSMSSYASWKLTWWRLSHHSLRQPWDKPCYKVNPSLSSIHSTPSTSASPSLTKSSPITPHKLKKSPWKQLSLHMKQSISTNPSGTYLAKPPHSALRPQGTPGRNAGLSRTFPPSAAAMEIRPPYMLVSWNLLSHSSQHDFFHMARLLSSTALHSILLAHMQLLFCLQEPLPCWEPLGFPHDNVICALGKGDR